nr:hypothetical protein [Polyangiaceae bacterium]
PLRPLMPRRAVHTDDATRSDGATHSDDPTHTDDTTHTDDPTHTDAPRARTARRTARWLDPRRRGIYLGKVLRKVSIWRTYARKPGI